jgi:hypothetical protein
VDWTFRILSGLGSRFGCKSGSKILEERHTRAAMQQQSRVFTAVVSLIALSSVAKCKTKNRKKERSYMYSSTQTRNSLHSRGATCTQAHRHATHRIPSAFRAKVMICSVSGNGMDRLPCSIFEPAGHLQPIQWCVTEFMVSTSSMHEPAGHLQCCSKRNGDDPRV